MIELINDYGSPYQAEILAERPADSRLEREFAPEGIRPRDGLIVSVFPNSLQPWIGKFSFGETMFNALVACPVRRRLLVVARGACYIVNVEDPDEYWVPDSGFGEGVACIKNPNLVLLWDSGDILATDGEQTVWSWIRPIDGISEVRQIGSCVSVTAFDPSEKGLHTFLLDAATGKEA